MSSTTPTRPLECSAKRLLKRVQMCTERSFVCTPIRNRSAPRKTAPTLSDTFASGITLLSIDDETIIGGNTSIDETQLSLDQTLTETKKKLSFDDSTISSTWEVINSTAIDQSDYTIISNYVTCMSDTMMVTANETIVSRATVASKKSKVSHRPATLLSRILKPATPKSLNHGVKFVNRCVRDIDRLNDTFGKEWITLPNFV